VYFSANCIWRGLLAVLVTRPPAAVSIAVLGALKLGVLVTLIASARSCRRCVPMRKLLEEREIERLVAVFTQNTATGIAVGELRRQDEGRLVEPQLHGGLVELTRSDAVGPLATHARVGAIAR